MNAKELKTIDPYFTKVWNRDKKFECRLNDREYETGDTTHVALIALTILILFGCCPENKEREIIPLEESPEWRLEREYEMERIRNGGKPSGTFWVKRGDTIVFNPQ